MQETSLSLLERLASDASDNDWRRMMSIYRPLMFHRISTYPLLVDQAEDIVQETMMVVMREIPVFQRQRTGSFRTWLRTILLNQLRYAARKLKKTPLPAGQNEKLLSQIELLADPASEQSSEFDREHDKAVFRHAAEIVRSEIAEHTWKASRQSL